MKDDELIHESKYKILRDNPPPTPGNSKSQLQGKSSKTFSFTHRLGI
jgi:hypothetical protein